MAIAAQQRIGCGEYHSFCPTCCPLKGDMQSGVQERWRVGMGLGLREAILPYPILIEGNYTLRLDGWQENTAILRIKKGFSVISVSSVVRNPCTRAPPAGAATGVDGASRFAAHPAETKPFKKLRAPFLFIAPHWQCGFPIPASVRFALK